MNDLSLDDLLAQATAAVLINGKTIATAWLVNHEGYLLTAGHVLCNTLPTCDEFYDHVYVQFTDDVPRLARATRAVVFQQEWGIDFAFLQLMEIPPNRHPLRTSFERTVTGKFRLRGYGQALADPATGVGEFTGVVDRQNSSTCRLFRLKSQALVDEGFSGGAVYSETLDAVVAIQTEAGRRLGPTSQTALAMPLYRIAEQSAEAKRLLNPMAESKMAQNQSMTLEESIVLITDPEQRRFGTGFTIYRDSFASYVLTCQHVVRDIGKDIKADGYEAQLIASGAKYGLDLALLRVEGLVDKALFNLSLSGNPSSSVIIVGYQPFRQDFLASTINGKLKRSIRIRPKLLTYSIKMWHLDIVDEYDLQKGYSGSPVIERSSGHVVGIVTHREGSKKGYMLVIEHLKDIWPDVLPKPFQKTVPQSVDKSLIDQTAQVKIDRLTRKANDLFAQAREEPCQNTSIYAEALTQAALGKWLYLRKVPYRAIILLQEALRWLPEAAEERTRIQTWHDIVSQSEQTHLNAMIYLASRGLRGLEAPEQTLAKGEIEETEANGEQ